MRVKAIVEIPQGSYLKYEQDKKDGCLTLDRVLNQPVPYNYGYIPGTLCEDGDPLDVFIVCNESIHPLTKVDIEIVGVLKCKDSGEQDDKILAVIAADRLTPHTMGSRLIMNYLQTYKKGFIVESLDNQEKALEVYKEGVRLYEQNSRT